MNRLRIHLHSIWRLGLIKIFCLFIHSCFSHFFINTSFSSCLQWQTYLHFLFLFHFSFAFQPSYFHIFIYKIEHHQVNFLNSICLKVILHLTNSYISIRLKVMISFARICIFCTIEITNSHIQILFLLASYYFVYTNLYIFYPKINEFVHNNSYTSELWFHLHEFVYLVR